MGAIAEITNELMQFVHDLSWRGTQAYRGHRNLSAALLLSLFLRPVFGQNYLTATGSPSFGTPLPVALGTVDASTGNLHLSIPLGSYPQRGTSQPEPVTLEYDSNIWTVGLVGYVPSWVPNNGPAMWSNGGWYFSYLAETGTEWQGYVTNYSNCTTDVPWMDQNGTTHLFHVATVQADSNCPAEASGYATDSSGYEMFLWNNNVSSMKIYAPDGTLVFQYPFVEDSNDNWILSVDSNGNYLSRPQSDYYSIADTLDRSIAAGGPGNSATLSTSQGTVQYQITYATITVNTNFQQSGIKDTTDSITVIRSFTLPDAAQSKYYFTYDCDETNNNNPAGVCTSPGGRSAYYGGVTGITLPTGGTESYSYQIFSDAYGNKSNWVSAHSSAGGSWSYTPQVVISCGTSGYYSGNPLTGNCQQTVTVTSPTDQTIYTFGLNNGAWPLTVQQEDLSNNLLSTVVNTWNFSQPCVTNSCNGNQFVRLSGQQTNLPSSNGTTLKKLTWYSYDSAQFNYQYGNKTAVEEWKYIPSGNSFPSVPDRTTYMTYLYYTGVNNVNVTGLNNINRPTSVTLCNNSGSSSSCPGGGSVVSQTQYTYDAYGSGGIGSCSSNGSSGLTTVTGVASHDDANFAAGNTQRGNITSMCQWVGGTNYLTTSFIYDTTGQILSSTDPNHNVTTYGYADRFFTDGGNGTAPSPYSPTNPFNGSAIETNAYLTSVTDAIGTQTIGYYWGSGKTAVITDYNNQSTYSHYQDGLDRQTEEIDPIGWSLASYPSATQSDAYTAVGDVSPSVSCVSCQHRQTILDTWGRTASQILVNNPIGPVEVDNSYDTGGRLSTQSHSYSGSGDPNHVLETFSYDALNRPISTQHPDGQIVPAAYGSNVSTLQGTTTQQGSTATYGYGYPQLSEDESGHLQEQWLDGFGRVIEVDEPNPATGSLTSSPLVTNYLYDAAGHLTQVVQGVQTRTFQYDGLGRKVYENTPEGGTVTYSYTASGGALCSGDPSNVCFRTDARNVVSTYAYDHANRITGVAYTIPVVPPPNTIAAMPNVCITSNGTQANVCDYYDQTGTDPYPKGRLTSIIDPTGSESYVHDADGRVTLLSKILNSQTYNIGYTYDAGGDVTQITYPSGRIVQRAYNNVGQTCQIAPSATNCSAASSYYAANLSYNAPGKLTGFNYGNGVTASFYYSPDRTQLTYLAYANGNSNYFNLQYSYQQSSTYSPPCPNGTTKNNGSIQCIADNMDTGRSANYSYDPLKRVNSALTCGSSAFPQWGLAETYDRFGNRWSQTGTAGTVPTSSLTFGTNGINGSTTNEPNGYTYDLSGNITVEPLVPQQDYMTYDGENRMTAVSGGGASSYTYDGNGMRVVRSVQGGATTVSIFSGSSVIAEYDNGAAPSSPSREYVYNTAGDTAGLLAMFSGGATTYYHHDHLSVRFATDGTVGSPTYGQVVSQEGHYPFGEQWYMIGPSNKWFFTNYNRDSESGLDYALARYYDSRIGTFSSADPLAGSPRDPQSWNRYAYGRNNPISITDPTGQHWWDTLFDYLFGNTPNERSGPGEGSPRAPDSPQGIPGTMPGQGDPMDESLGLPGGWTPPTTGDPVQDLAHALGLPSMADVINPAMSATAANGTTFDWGTCMANGANAVSLARLLPKGSPQFLKNYLSNDFATVQQLVTGPDSVRALESVEQGRGWNFLGMAVGKIVTGPDTANLGENGAGTAYVRNWFTPTVATSTAGKLIMTAVKFKSAYDLGSYLGGVVTCPIFGR